jgi:hypothetical protein
MKASAVTALEKHKDEDNKSPFAFDAVLKEMP